METKICPNCNNTNDAKMKFCVYCGQPLSDASVNQNNPAPPNEVRFAPKPPNQMPNFPPVTTAPPKKSKMWLLALIPVIGIIGFLGLGAVMFFFFFRGGDGKIVNVNTNSSPNVLRPSPTPVREILYTKSAADYLKDSPIGDFAPGVTAEKKDVEQQVKAIFPYFTGTIQDAASKEYFRDEPDEQVFLWVVKYASPQTAENNCQMYKSKAGSYTGRNFNENSYQIEQAQMPIEQNTAKQTIPGDSRQGCQVWSQVETDDGSVSVAVWSQRNLLFIASASESSAKAMKSFVPNYQQWFSTGQNVADKNVSAGLKTAIVGKWKDPTANGVMEFQADKKLSIYDSAGKMVMQGNYEVLGEDMILLFKSTGESAGQSKVSVSGDTLILDGSTLKRIN